MLFYFIFGKVYAFIFNIDMNYDREMSLALSFEKIFFQALESFRIAVNFLQNTTVLSTKRLII